MTFNFNPLTNASIYPCVNENEKKLNSDMNSTKRQHAYTTWGKHLLYDTLLLYYVTAVTKIPARK